MPKKPTKKSEIKPFSKKMAKDIARLASKGAFDSFFKQAKKVEKSSSRKPKSILPKGINDIQIGAAGFKRTPTSNKSGIFKGESSEKIKEFIKSGLDALPRSFRRLPVANVNSFHALPQTGDPGYLVPAGIHTGLSFQGRQAEYLVKDIANEKDRKEIKSSLKIKAGANVTAIQPFFHTPGNAQDAWNLPKSYVEQIRWSRLMFNLNPYISSISKLKAYYPLSKFKLITTEPWVTQFYESNSFNKRFNLYNFICRMNLSLKKFGEAVVWGIRRQDGIWPQTGQPRWVWDSFVLLEPELLEIKRELIGGSEAKYFLRPNRDLEDLVRKMRSNDPDVAHLQGQLAEPIMRKIERRELVPLDPTTISGIFDYTDGSATRGTPPYQCLFVNFIFEDFVRLALMAQANRYHFPIELWLLGNLEKGIMPTVSDLISLRDMVTQAIQNPPFSVFYPPILDYKAVGVSGSLMDIKADMEYAHKQYLIGMGVNENMILGESGIFSSNETAGNQSFIRMMIKDRHDIEEWCRWNFYEPLAQWNNLKVNKNGILEPIVPEMEWEKTLDFKAEQDEIENQKWLWDAELADPETTITVVGKRNPEEVAIKMSKAAGGPFDVGGRFSKAAITKEGAKAEEGPAKPTTPVEAPGGTGEGEGGPEGGPEGGSPAGGPATPTATETAPAPGAAPAGTPA